MHRIVQPLSTFAQYFFSRLAVHSNNPTFTRVHVYGWKQIWNGALTHLIGDCVIDIIS